MGDGQKNHNHRDQYACKAIHSMLHIGLLSVMIHHLFLRSAAGINFLRL